MWIFKKGDIFKKEWFADFRPQSPIKDKPVIPAHVSHLKAKLFTSMQLFLAISFNLSETPLPSLSKGYSHLCFARIFVKLATGNLWEHALTVVKAQDYKNLKWGNQLATERAISFATSWEVLLCFAMQM